MLEKIVKMLWGIKKKCLRNIWMVPKHPWKQHKQVAGLYRPTRKTGHTRYVIQPTRAFATRIGMLSIAQLIGMLQNKSFTFICPKCLLQFALGTPPQKKYCLLCKYSFWSVGYNGLSWPCFQSWIKPTKFGCYKLQKFHFR